ncbi:MAG: NADH-quinone oxidoreductase subunit H, partial [Proteobacteria bacterium]|nr:NADH-quinone oxidoreductase subunit H [Pseudomonadota bacterium]
MWNSLPPLVQYVTIVTWKVLFVVIVVMLTVAFSTYFERKVIGSMQARIGPNRVGPLGLG